MIGKSTLKGYEFNSITDYYDYIVESKINGNFEQVRNLTKRLSGEQKAEFLHYVINNFKEYDTYFISLINGYLK